ncbi:hypothetical protein BDY19DRAFT_449511 [Irpex rosettiformis]|uniref:Uncharacterized protein n=1 Tax=Irpex rosettiformis TaxID=378272 RepID=A0ACB8TTY2_9APHY|nr:hypothetical protein BDY19DRAFT_449511 [Irpex rosettiformis]
MRLDNRLKLWTILLVPPTWALNGDSWCGTLMCVDAIVNGSTVTYRLKALNQLGWMSIGFGPRMDEAPLVVLWPNEDGSVTLSQRVADGHVPPQLDPDPPRVATISAHVDLSSDTSPILAFDIPNDNNTSQSLIWAFGVARPAPDVASNIDQHLDAGAFSLDLLKHGGKEEGEGEDGTSSSPSSTLVPSSVLPSLTPTPSLSTSAQETFLTSVHTVASTTSDLSSASALPQAQPLDSPSLVGDRSRHNVLVAHAVFSFLGFCVFLPASAIATRWLRTVSPNWFLVHWCIVAFLAIPFGTIGWALGVAVVALRGQRHVNNEHQITGVIFPAICLAQVALGVFIHQRQPKHGRIHPLRNYAHALLGLAIVGFAFSVAKTGFTRDATLGTSLRKALSIACVVIAVLVAAAYLTGVVRLRRQFDQERLGWHLSLASSSTTTATTIGTGLFRPHQREAQRSFGVGQRGGTYQPDDEPRDVRRSTSFSSGPVRRGGAPLGTSVEMRELQSSVPVSASLRTQFVMVNTH